MTVRVVDAAESCDNNLQDVRSFRGLNPLCLDQTDPVESSNVIFPGYECLYTVYELLGVELEMMLKLEERERLKI